MSQQGQRSRVFMHDSCYREHACGFVQEMSIIALVDTSPEIPGESIGTVVSTHDIIAGRVQSERGISKADAGERRKGSRPDENRDS